MKRFVIALVLFYFISEFSSPVIAAVGSSGPNPKRKPGGCYEANTGHLKGGQEITIPGQCVSASCSSDGSIGYTSCGKIGTRDPKCRLSGADLSKPYPACCPKIICSP